MNIHDTRLDENGNVFTVEEMINPADPSLTNQLLAARQAWTRKARANAKLKVKLKEQKKLSRQLWNGTKEVTAELDQKVTQLRDVKTELAQIHTIAERRERQLRGLRKENIELLEKNLMLAEKVDQLERGVTEVKSDPEFDWHGEFERERNRREIAEAMVGWSKP